MENLHRKATDHEDLPNWMQPPYTPPDAELEEDAGKPEDGIDYGILILPPLQEDEPLYPEDYVKYCQDRMRKYSREHGKPPEWEWEKEG